VIEKSKVKVAAKSDESVIVGQVIVSVVTAIATTIVLGLLGLSGNWASQGGLVRLIGGVSRAELADDIDKQLSKSAQFLNSIKLEMVPGKWSNSIAKLADGSVVVAVSQEECPAESIIVGGYCGAGQNSAGAKGNLQDVGLFDGRQFLCKWGTTTNSETLKVSAQALCLRVARK
jgi:hypothetical protein